MHAAAVTPTERPTRVRHLIIGFLFLVTAVNYADRATLSIVGTRLAHDLQLDQVQLGYLLSAFSWAYVVLQLPGGWLLDRFGSRSVYQVSLLAWSVCTLLQGFVGPLGGMISAAAQLFFLRLLLGAAEAPSFPANSRIVAMWFPTSERGLASAIFNSAQYFSTVLFYPLMGALTHLWDWPAVFWMMGAVGLVLGVLWPRIMQSPRTHPRVNAAELAHITKGGGLVDLDGTAAPAPAAGWSALGQLLTNRMLVGIFLGQYCINVLTWFFLTWFPIYLVKERHMQILTVGFVAVLPALCGFLGGVLGGGISDRLLQRGHSLSFARKAPLVVGLLLSVVILACNHVETQAAVIACMSLAYFGKGLGALGWAVMADVAPRTATGLSGAVFNTFGNLAGAITPIVIGYLVDRSGSFRSALVYVGVHGVLAVFCYLAIVGEIRRFELRGEARNPAQA